jgi:transposase
MRIKIAEHNTIEEIENEIKLVLPGRYRLRLQTIFLAKKGMHPNDIQTILLVSTYAYYDWIHKYNSGGMQALKQHNSGRKEGNPKYDSKIFVELFEKLDLMQEYWSIPKMQKLVLELHKIDVPYETMRMRVKRAGYSYKSNRPSPYKGDEELQKEFKKTVSQKQ